MSDWKFSICNANNALEAEKWISAWESWPLHEVYAHPYYVRLYADGNKNRALCALLESNEGCVLYPFILRDLRFEQYWTKNLPPLFDIITPYGYGGAFSWNVCDQNQLQEQFWKMFNRWAVETGVVSEFVRFSLFGDTLLSYPGNSMVKLKNVVRSLDTEEADMWMDFKHKVRKNVKQAQRSEVRVEIDSTNGSLDDFLRIYNQTLNRKSASLDYYFSREYFESLIHDLRGQFLFFHALLNNRIISTELVLLSKENVYSFLGGTDEAYFDVRPNDLLKYEIVHWSKANGKKQFVLGGGYIENDGIFQYKLSFAPSGIVPFSVGTRVLNKHFYDALVNNRKTSSPEWKPVNGYFPLYRA